MLIGGVPQGSKQAPYCLYLVLNLRNVASIDPVAMRLIAQLRDSLKAQGVTLLVCYGTRFQDPLVAEGIEAQAQFSDDDAALEHCEDRLLQDIVGGEAERPQAAIRLLEGMSRQLSANLRRSNAEVAAFKG